MKLNDYYTTKGPFVYMSQIGAMPWDGLVEPSVLDAQYLFNRSGKKKVTDIVRHFSAPLSEPEAVQLTRVVREINIRNWERLWDTYTAQYSPTDSFGMTETVKRKSNGESSDNGTDTTDYGMKVDSHSNSDDSTYGFNSTEQSPTDISVNTGGTVNSGTDTRTKNNANTHSDAEDITRIKNGNIGVHSYQSLLKNEIELWKWNYFEQVFEDCDKILVLPIFDQCECSKVEYHSDPLEPRVDTLEKSMKGVKSRLDSDEYDIRGIKENLAHNNNSISTLDSRTTSNKESIIKLERDIANIPTVVVDDMPSLSSPNPIQNKVITKLVNDVASKVPDLTEWDESIKGQPSRVSRIYKYDNTLRPEEPSIFANTVGYIPIIMNDAFENTVEPFAFLRGERKGIEYTLEIPKKFLDDNFTTLFERPVIYPVIDIGDYCDLMPMYSVVLPYEDEYEMSLEYYSISYNGFWMTVGIEEPVSNRVKFEVQLYYEKDSGLYTGTATLVSI